MKNILEKPPVKRKNLFLCCYHHCHIPNAARGKQAVTNVWVCVYTCLFMHVRAHTRGVSNLPDPVFPLLRLRPCPSHDPPQQLAEGNHRSPPRGGYKPTSDLTQREMATGGEGREKQNGSKSETGSQSLLAMTPSLVSAAPHLLGWALSALQKGRGGGGGGCVCSLCCHCPGAQHLPSTPLPPHGPQHRAVRGSSTRA